jgi:hypothetical protein
MSNYVIAATNEERAGSVCSETESKSGLGQLPLDAVGSVAFFAFFCVCVVFEHVRRDYRYWTGWRDELAFWAGGALCLLSILASIPIRLYHAFADVQRGEPEGAPFDTFKGMLDDTRGLLEHVQARQ